MDRAQLLILKSEISLPAYAGMTNQQIAEALNAKTQTRNVRVPMSAINEWANAHRIFKRFADANKLSDPLYLELDQLIKGRQEAVNFASGAEGVGGLISDLTTAGILTAAEAQDLQSLGVESCSRADLLGLPWIYPAYCVDARRLEG